MKIFTDLKRLKGDKMTKQLYRVERERVVTDWWYVEANDEKEAKTKAFNSEIDDSDYGEDLNVTVNKVEEKKGK
jgi:exoribonuclease II